MTHTFADLETLARTLYGEARGEPDEGKAAIAWVVLNRLAQPGWWSRDKNDGIQDDTVAAVCRDPAQFTCWWDEQRERLENATLADAGMASCVRVALDVLAGRTPDPTAGANHYLTTRCARETPPRWYDPSKVTATIGAHQFLKL